MSATNGDCSPAICSLTAFLSFAFILTGLVAVIGIAAVALWLPVEIEKGGKTIKERNNFYFKANARAESRQPETDRGQH